MKKKLRFNKNILINDIKVWTPALIIFLIYHTLAIKFFKAACPLILLWGIPCPGCGMTRAISLVVTLHFEKAFYLNPVAFLWVAFIIYFVINRYFSIENKRVMYLLLSIVLILTFARYIYGMIVFYPNRIPYVHTSRNLTNLLYSIKQ